MTTADVIQMLRSIQFQLWSNAMDCRPRLYMSERTIGKLGGGFDAYKDAFDVIKKLISDIEEDA